MKTVERLEQRLLLFENKEPTMFSSDSTTFNSEKLRLWNDENDRRIKLLEHESKVSIATKITETEAMYQIREIQQRKEFQLKMEQERLGKMLIQQQEADAFELNLKRRERERIDEAEAQRERSRRHQREDIEDELDAERKRRRLEEDIQSRLDARLRKLHQDKNDEELRRFQIESQYKNLYKSM